MKAAWYEKQGPAHDVLVVGEMDDPILVDVRTLEDHAYGNAELLNPAVILP